MFVLLSGISFFSASSPAHTLNFTHCNTCGQRAFSYIVTSDHSGTVSHVKLFQATFLKTVRQVGDRRPRYESRYMLFEILMHDHTLVFYLTKTKPKGIFSKGDFILVIKTKNYNYD